MIYICVDVKGEIASSFDILEKFVQMFCFYYKSLQFFDFEQFLLEKMTA